MFRRGVLVLSVLFVTLFGLMFVSAIPKINFTSITPADGLISNYKSILINISINDTHLDSFNFSFNNVNYTFFDKSLMLWLNFDNIAALTESASRAVDISNYTNNANIAGRYVAGKYGQAINFNTNTYDNVVFSSQYANVSAPNLLLSENFTISCWIKLYSYNQKSDLSGWSSSCIYREKYGSTVKPVAYALIVENATGIPQFRMDNESSITILRDSRVNLSLFNWTHLSGVYNGSKMSFYVNGVLVNSTEKTGNVTQDTTKSIYLGNSPVSSSSPAKYAYLAGAIDQVVIYNRSLSSLEITQLYYSNFYRYKNSSYAFYSNQTLGMGYYNFSACERNLSDVNTVNNYNCTVMRTIYNDNSYPAVNFSSPTLSHNNVSRNLSVEINVSIAGVYDLNGISNLTEVKFNWNGTNYTVYNSSLVLMMNFDANTKLNDSSIYGINLSCSASNCPIFNLTGKYGGAYTFNGSGDYLTIPFSQRFNMSNRITVSCWVNLASYEFNISRSDWHSSCIYKSANSSNSPYTTFGLTINSSGSPSFQADIVNSDYYSAVNKTPISLNTWHHMLGSLNATGLSLYVDGVLVATKTRTTNVNLSMDNTNLTIGNSLRVGGAAAEYGYFNGSIDEVRIWNRAMSSSEAKQEYYSNLAKFNLSQWHFYSNQTDVISKKNYTYYLCAEDGLANENCTETRKVVMGSPLSVSYTFPTDADNAYFYKTNVYINVTALIPNFKNLTIFLYNSDNSLNNSNSTTTRTNITANFTGLSEGVYHFDARGYDTSGNYDTENLRTVTIDRTLPVTIINAPTNGQALYSKLININLTINEININYTNITIYNNSVSQIMNTTTTSLNGSVSIYLAVSSDGNYTINVTSYDYAGNVNSTQINVVNVSQDIVPVLSFIDSSEISGSYISRNNTLMNVTASGTGITNVTLKLFNSTGLIYNATNFTSQTLFSNYTDLVDGKYFFNATACNNLNTCTDSETRNVTIDTLSPVISLTSPANNSVIAPGIFSINFVLTELNLNYTNVSIALLDDSSFVVNYTNSSLNGSVSLSISISQDENYTLNITSIDLAGNINTSITLFSVNSSTVPTVIFESDSEVSGSAFARNNIFINASRSGIFFSNMTIFLSNSSSLIYSNITTDENYAINYTSLPDETYYFNATACSVYGCGNSAERRTVTIDTTGPTFTNLVNQTIVDFIGLQYNFTANDPLGVSCFRVNDSVNFAINCSGYLENATTLTGFYYLLISVNDSLNNTREGLININVTTDTAPVLSVNSPINNSVYYTNQSIIIQFSASDSNLFNLWFSNGSVNTTYIANTMTPINFSLAGNYNIWFYANDTSANISTRTINVSIIDLSVNTTLVTNETSLEINNSNLTNVVIAYNSSIRNITLANATQTVYLNFTQLFNGSIVSLVNEFMLVRVGTPNYTVIIPAGTNISASNWNALIKIPIVSTTTFTISSGTVDKVINVGSDVEINFSQPVKVIIGGMSGKKAAWARGTTVLTAISTVCNSLTNPTNIDAVTTRECYINSGSDLAIWTYHFTDFAAYTSTTTTTSGTTGGSSGGTTITTGWVNLTVTSTQLNNGYDALIRANYSFKLNISSRIYYVNVLSIDSSRAVIEVIGKGTNSFYLNTEKKYDLNNDGYYDLDLRLTSLTFTSSGRLYLKAINELIVTTTEPVGIVETVKEEVKQIVQNVTEEVKDKGWFYIFIIIAGFALFGLVVGIVVYFKRDRAYTKAIKVREY